jgi:predicted DNA-binding transcriptional regulator YafY
VLPPRLRQRVNALQSVTVPLAYGGATVDPDALTLIATACRDNQRLRFDYRNHDGTASLRTVEPHRLVHTGRRWYLVAWDSDRHDWRTFRVDRIGAPAPTGVPFERADPPDAAALVAHGVAFAAHPIQARIRLHLAPEHAARLIAPTDGVVEPETATTTLARVGGDKEWIAEFVAGLPCRVEVLEPQEVRVELRRLAERLVRDHA